MLKSAISFKVTIFWVFILSSAFVVAKNENSEDSLPKILLIDSQICLEALPKDLSAKLAKAESESPVHCKKSFQEDPRPFHGQLTLKSFLTHLKTDQRVNFVHLNPFDENGQQNLERFKQIHKRLNNEVFSLVMMPMAGLLPALKELTLDSWRSPFFLASGQKGRGSLSETQFMWPQSLFSQKKPDFVFVVGTYLPLNPDLVVENSELFHQNQIDLFLPENESFSEFTGSSRGTAEAAARALNYCHKATESFLSCVKKQIISIATTNGRNLPTL